MEALPKTAFKFILHFMKKYWVSFVLMQIFYLGMTIDNVIWPQITRMIISTIEGYTGEKEHIWTAISGVVFLGAAVWIIIEICFRCAFLIAMRVLPKLESDIRMALFKYLGYQSHEFFSNNFAGSLANKVNDMPRSSYNIITMIMSLFIPVILTTLILTSMFARIYPLFGVIIFTWFIIHIGICLYTAKTCSHYADIHAESRSKLSGRMVDSFANSISVRLFSRRTFEFDYIMEQQEDEVAKHKQALWYIEKVKIILGIICFILLGIFLTSTQIYTYKKGIISLSDLVFTLQASFHITMLAWWAGLELPRFFQEVGVCQQALGLLGAEIKVLDRPGAQRIIISKGEIIFDKVTFRYQHNSNIFEENSIHIKSGEKVGLVGFSGSGKTTFVNLLLRYFDVNDGRILIDGQDISCVTQDSLREQIAVIPQEPMLFHRSLKENIRYGNIHASDEEVIAAAHKAHCHEFIIKLKHGYNTTVGERGLKLSGGQRQRIAIARAILKKAPILIMDEATSALDSITEHHIQESIKSISKHCTSIIIAHRLSTLADMDRILVFKDGDIVEDGSHEQLLALDSHYRKLWNTQINGFIPNEEV